jgi:surface carbohydrate biosynthesis protein
MDVLIYTEVDNRELDAACLVKTELERRGYKVALERYNRICESGNLLLYRPKLLILPWVYGDNYLSNFLNNNSSGSLKIINLQSEQILSQRFIDNNYHMPKGTTKQYKHLAWGRVTEKRYLDSGINKNNILTLGNINMDFNKQKFKNLYLNRKEVALKYSLDEDKKWCLFISSFTHPSMSKEEISSYLERFPFLKNFVEISTASQKTIIKWVEKFVSTNKDVIFIYRPHPIELDNAELSALSEKYANFFIISELSVRQWIHVCDRINTWFSTSIVDVFYQGKKCLITRPIAIPKDLDCEIFIGCNAITNYEKFEYFNLNKEESEFPIKEELIKDYYGECNNFYIYENFCDEVEKLIKHRKCLNNFILNISLVSRINRNIISFIFHFNKYINMSRLLRFSQKKYLKEQLIEKWKTRKQYKQYKTNLCKKLSEVLK